MAHPRFPPSWRTGSPLKRHLAWLLSPWGRRRLQSQLSPLSQKTGRNGKQPPPQRALTQCQVRGLLCLRRLGLEDSHMHLSCSIVGSGAGVGSENGFFHQVVRGCSCNGSQAPTSRGLCGWHPLRSHRAQGRVPCSWSPPSLLSFQLSFQRHCARFH